MWGKWGNTFRAVSFLNEHLSRLKLKNNDECRLCGENGETPETSLNSPGRPTTIRAVNFGTTDIGYGELNL